MLTIEKRNGTGELLPRLEKILSGKNLQISRVNAGGSHAGWVTSGAVFVAKKALWKNQVSTQKELLDKCNMHGRWLIFWIPGTGALKFDPERFLEKGWKNMRDTEEMVNIDIRYGTWISGEQLDVGPIHKVEQLSLLGESRRTQEILESGTPVHVNEIITAPDPIVQELKGWRQKLGIVMGEYADFFKIPLHEVEMKLYRKYSIGSRTELSTDQLHAEYQSYKTAIQNGLK